MEQRKRMGNGREEGKGGCHGAVANGEEKVKGKGDNSCRVGPVHMGEIYR